MSFIDEIRSDTSAWLARARAEPEEPLVSAGGLSLSADDAERLEEAVSGKSPSYDRPIISVGLAALGGAEPTSGQQAQSSATRITGGRSGIFVGQHGRRDDQVTERPDSVTLEKSLAVML